MSLLVAHALLLVEFATILLMAGLIQDTTKAGTYIVRFLGIVTGASALWGTGRLATIELIDSMGDPSLWTLIGFAVVNGIFFASSYSVREGRTWYGTPRSSK